MFKFISRSQLLLILLISITPFLLTSCKRNRKHKKKPVYTDFSYDDFAEKLTLLVPGLDTIPQKDFNSIHANLRLAYELNDHDPIWLAHGYKAHEAANKMIEELETINWDGLNPNDYNVGNIKKLRDKLGKNETTLNDAIAFDTTLTISYLNAACDLLLGTVNIKKADSLWYHTNDSVFYASSLLNGIQIKYISLDTFRSAFPTYRLLLEEHKRLRRLAMDTTLLKSIAALKAGVTGGSASIDVVNDVVTRKLPWLVVQSDDTLAKDKRLLLSYQYENGLKPTAKPDSITLASLCKLPDTSILLIKANLERLRWMQRDPGNTYVIVDVPMMELYFRKKNANALHMNVVVGKKARQTPSLNATMANIVLNPQWGVPPTILKKDVLPGVERSGNSYLAKKGLKVYDSKGKRVNNAVITKKNYKRYQYRQDPGDGNALGYVKFNLPNKWDIYLHDTPHRTDFGKWDRALSSGCIRLHHPQEMALFIFNEIENQKFTQGKLDTVIKTHKTQWHVLKHKMPVYITYLTAFEDTTGSHIRYTRDIYKRDEKLIALLKG